MRRLAAVVACAVLGCAAPALAQAPPLEVCPVPPCAAIDHGERHTGVDVRFTYGEQVLLNYPAEVIDLVQDTAAGPLWRGVVLRLAPPSADITFRLLGVTVSHRIGARVGGGVPIGFLQDGRSLWPRVLPHVHVEAYVNGVRVDPTPYINALWPGRPIENPGADYFRAADSRAQIASERAWAAFRNQQFAEAIPLFEVARTRNGWETGWFDLMGAQAHAHARTGDFTRATALQEQYVSILDLVLDFAAGHLPAPELGTISAAPSVQSATIKSERAKRTLDAYRNRDAGPGFF